MYCNVKSGVLTCIPNRKLTNVLYRWIILRNLVFDKIPSRTLWPGHGNYVDSVDMQLICHRLRMDGIVGYCTTETTFLTGRLYPQGNLHWIYQTSNFTNSEFQSPQFKVLQSGFFFWMITYIGVFFYPFWPWF